MIILYAINVKEVILISLNIIAIYLDSIKFVTDVNF